MHELCHLYSVGSYNLTDSDKFIFSHKCGINKYEYYSNDGLKKHVISEDYFLNELFNDFVANFLFDKIYGKPYYQYRSLKDFTDKLINYLNDSNIDIFKFIGSYFSDADNSILELIKNI